MNDLVRRVMVSIRRRRLLGLCSSIQGKNSVLDPVPRVLEHGHTPLPLNDDYKPKHETSLENEHGSPDLSSSSPSKEHPFRQFPEVKRRKRHRRKQVQNQEPCTMRGVYYKNRKWQAAIKVDRKQIHLGTVSTEEEAARLYDRAAFMCGREPNTVISEEEKEELRKYKWDEFLAMTRSSITNKKVQRRTGSGSRRKSQNDEHGYSGLSASEDDIFAP
ncbi:PREDICTED: ethylene-responsive transcription factor-like protein At4g13040 isoform X1 [Erythranthe guttata]|nr:PREDICTED: ethylene-responsive transcription factor-like protein At4g13040 isoform X1 [Erythranthe guttata]|eukprot:XP_012833547.1 PREDICTED: ethylene-responsive transcription factor-like protein At4g13040 isoform X1 [Erythranthe guttata]